MELKIPDREMIEDIFRTIDNEEVVDAKEESWKNTEWGDLEPEEIKVLLLLSH